MNQIVPPTFFDPGIFAAALFLSILVNRIVAYFATPIFEARKWDKKYLMYIAALVGLTLSWLANLNLLPGLFPNPLVGIVVTAFIVGGGANLLHDIIDGIAGAFGGTLLTGNVQVQPGAVKEVNVSTEELVAVQPVPVNDQLDPIYRATLEQRVPFIKYPSETPPQPPTETPGS